MTHMQQTASLSAAPPNGTLLVLALHIKVVLMAYPCADIIQVVSK